MSTPNVLLGVLLTIVIGLFQFRIVLRDFLEMIEINTGGGTLMTRLLPNLAFFGLFMILIGLCWS